MDTAGFDNGRVTVELRLGQITPPLGVSHVDYFSPQYPRTRLFLQLRAVNRVARRLIDQANPACVYIGRLAHYLAGRHLPDRRGMR